MQVPMEVLSGSLKTTWVNGLLGEMEQPVPLSRTSKASGMGIPKKGKDVLKSISLSPKEMRAAAKDIEECSQALASWLVTPSKLERQRLLALAIVARANLHHKS